MMPWPIAMNRIIDPPEGVTSALKDTLTAVDSVDKVDDYTVKFSLNNSTPYFLEILVAGNMVMYSDEELDANKRRPQAAGDSDRHWSL